MLRTTTIKDFTFSEYSHKGQVRENNEDYFLSSDTVNGYVFVVCDGVGGGNAGEVASEIAAKNIISFLSEKWGKKPFDLLNNALENANSEILRQAQLNSSLRGMGTTITAVLIRDEKFYYAHAGDSRIYFSTAKKYFRLTKDHSFVQNLIDKGDLTEAEAELHPKKNQITKAAGIFAKLNPVVSKEGIIPEHGNFLILCSDGLYSEIPEKEIFEIIKTNEAENNIAEILTKVALDNGGNDNITVQVIRFLKTETIGKKEIETKNKIKPTTKKKYIYWAAAIFVFVTSLLSLAYILYLGEVERNVNAKTYQTSVSIYYLHYLRSDSLKTNGEYPTKPGDNIELLSSIFKTTPENIIYNNKKKSLTLLLGEKLIIKKAD